jgi:hypothetical protein
MADDPAAPATGETFTTLLSRVRRRVLGSRRDAAKYNLTRQVFLRSVGFIYVIAFVSLWVQIDGLIGGRGILPIADYMDAARSQLSGSDRFWLLPTLCWWNTCDTFLHVLCATGTVTGLLVIAGIAQLPALVIAWICYVSLTVAGQEFLSFQWDALLLEAGFLSIFLAPWQVWRFGRAGRSPPPEPSRVVIWLIRWLLFRVMFLSGVVKLSSGDTAWRAWTAMHYHYETQPLPPWTAWYFYQLPMWFQKASCGIVFFAELIVPVLIFTARRIRIAGMWLIILFQLLIIGTGNYGFFNLLTIALCFTLADDALWRALLRRREPLEVSSEATDAGSEVRRRPGLEYAVHPGLRSTSDPASVKPSRFSRLRWPLWITAPLAGLALLVTIPLSLDAFNLNYTMPAPISTWTEHAQTLRLFSNYGLFRVMTTERPELIIEGSSDGVTWKPYEFKWKMGDVNRRPAFCVPHMPRLDWQMWFAALDEGRIERWLYHFMARLLEGSPPVLALLANNPFPDHPPQYVRVMWYDYHFTDPATRRQTGAWWRREPLGRGAVLSQEDLRGRTVRSN